MELPTPHRPTVLVVEDNPVTRKTTRVALTAEEFVVVEAEDGRTALDIAARSAPDLVLQDLMLPDMDGFVLLQRLRELSGCRDIPILAFSGFLSRLEEGRASSIGFTDFIIKPVPPSEIVRTVRRHLAISGAGRESRGRCVLLVDDDAVQLRLGALRLSTAGFEVVTASDGVEALEVARRMPCDVIVTDALMPRLDGFGLCLAVRQDPALARTPVVIATSTYVDDADAALGRQMGANAFVIRTPSFDTVIDAVLTTLGQSPPSPHPSSDELHQTHVHRMVAQLERQAVINAGLFQRCSAQAAALAVLGTIAESLARNHDGYDVLQAVLTDCVATEGGSLAALYEADEEGHPLLRAQTGCEALAAADVKGFFGQPALFERVIRTGASIAIASLVDTPDAERAFLDRLGSASVTLTPLTFREDRIGVLLVGSDDKSLRTDERLDFAQALGLQIGQAMALGRAFAEAEAHVREANVFAELVGKINASLDLDTVLQQVVEGARDVLGTDRALIAMREPSTGAMTMRYLAGVKASGVGTWRVEHGKGSGGLVMATGTPFRTDDYAGDPRITKEYAPALLSLGVHAQIVVPIRTADGLGGLLYAETESARRFTALDEATLQRLADHAGIAIRNSELLARERQMRAAVETSEANARLLFANGPLPMWVFDADTLRFLEVNDAAVTVYGYSREEFLAMSVDDIRPPEEAARLLAHRRGAMESGSAPIRHSGVWQHRRKDGRVIVVDIAAHDFELAGRKATLVVAQDITARRQAETERDALAERYRNLFEQSPVGLFRSTRDGVVLDVNPALVQILHFPDKETYLAVGAAHHYLHPEVRERFMATIDRDGIIRDLEAEMRTHEGAVLWTLQNIRAIRDEDGGLYYEGTVQDISARKRAEAEKAQLEDQLRQTQKMEAIGSLAGGISHDFNNLLTVILGRSQLLLRRLTGDERSRRDLEVIEKTAERAAGLTRQLLAFSRKQVLQPRTLGLNSVVSETVTMLSRTIGEDIEVSSVPAVDLGLVSADPGQIEQVLLNLAVNARDAMPQGGRLTIETANVELDEGYTRAFPGLKPGPYVMLAVADTGTGMDAQTQARIFEPFFTTKPAGKGTGLGLATVYGIVKQSDGHIRVYSEPGVGTTFKVYLPRVASARGAQRPPRGEVAPPHGSETVLLVEDEEGVRELTHEVLAGQGYRVLVAKDYEEAMHISATAPERVHLLVSDVVMPHGGGPRLAEELMRARPDMRVLFISGYTDDAVVRHGVLTRSTAFLQKPFTPHALGIKVREVLDAVKEN